MKSPSLLLLLPMFVAVTGVACNKRQQTARLPGATDTVPAAPAYNLLALGDSYTIGQGVPATERFPAQTSDVLRSDTFDISNITYIAATGWTTVSLANAITAQNPPSNFDIVTLLIGVNDQYQRMDTAGYRQRFSQLVLKAVQLAGSNKERVFVLSIPDYSATPFVPAPDKMTVSREIDEFNSINKQVTLQSGISYTDITPSTRLASGDPTLIASDSLHPSEKAYKIWAEMLAPLIKTALR